MSLTTAIQIPDTRLSQREVIRKYAVKIVVTDVQSATMIQMEVIIYATNLTNQVPNTHAQK
jgi:hypothetical protein